MLTHPLTNLTVTLTTVDTGRLITSVRFGADAAANVADAANDESIQSMRHDFQRFLDGQLHNLDHLPLLLDRFTPFQRSVLRAARRIPWGEVVSYAQLAGMAGHPHAVRAAASVMRRNPFALAVPCHRVVRKDLTIGGFMGRKTGSAIALKRRLLEREGARGLLPMSNDTSPLKNP